MLSGAMLDNCGSAAKLSASSSPPDESVRLADKGLLDPPYTSTERGGYNLFERELDPFFFFARNEIVSDNDARAALLR